MKKGWLCVFLFLSGCASGYTLSRNPESDLTKILLLADDKEEWLSTLPEIDDVEVHFCQSDCKDEIEMAEKEYVDGLIAVGDTALKAVFEYANPNQIPVIEVKMNDQMDALKKIYPEYEWINANEENEHEQGYAYYYEMDVEVNADEPFYQKDHPLSLCTLVPDQNQLVSELDEKISLLLKDRLNDFTIYIDWVKN